MRDLVKFIDNLADLSCLVFDDTQKVYIPHDKEWIKSKCYDYLAKYAPKKQAEENKNLA